MENASKALLIAAGVLIAVILTTFGIKVTTSSKEAIGQSQEIGGTISSTSKDAIGKLSGILGTQGEAAHDAFIWKSDDPNSADYGIVIGYTANVQNYTILKYPSRCTEIRFEYDKKQYEKAGIIDDNWITSCFASRAFTNNIQKVEIPSTVNYIGEYAFGDVGTYANQSFSKVKEISISESVKSIGNYAFENCKSLTNVNIPKSITTIGVGMFRGCKGIKNINIPNSVTNIGAFAFENCNGLTNIDIPNIVTTISYRAFYGCTNLTQITIPDSVNYLDAEAFRECTNLKKIKIMSTELTKNSVINSGVFMDISQDSKIYVLSEKIKTILDDYYDHSKTTVKVVSLEEMNNL